MTDPTGVPTSTNPSAAGFRVDPEALLKASDILRNESNRLKYRLQSYGNDLVVGICGSDPISQPAADAFNTKIQTIVREATNYVNWLANRADELTRQAHSYGATDEQAKQALQTADDLRAETDSQPRVVPTGPTKINPATDPVRTIMSPYMPPAAPRVPGDRSPIINPSAGPPNQFPGLNTPR